MRGFNHVVLRGEVAGAPQVVSPRNAFPVVKVYVSIVEPRKNKQGGYVDTENVVPVVFFGDTADMILRDTEEGDMVIIDAKLKMDDRGLNFDEPQLQLYGLVLRNISYAPEEPYAGNGKGKMKNETYSNDWR